MKKRMVALAAASSVGAVIVPVVEAPQVALADASDCPSGYFCAWPLTQYGGTKYQWFNTATWSGAIRDTDSSWFNNSNQGNYVGVFGGLPGGGTYRTVCLAPGQKVASSTAYQNQGERHRFAPNDFTPTFTGACDG